MTERELLRRIWLRLAKEPDVVLWRNETAGAWVGRVERKSGRCVVLDRAQLINAGLCRGSSDLVGIGPGGRFLAIEVKTDAGRTTRQQEAFIDAVIRAGGIAGIVRSVEDALALVERAREE